jgi:hypothetical protein
MEPLLNEEQRKQKYNEYIRDTVHISSMFRRIFDGEEGKKVLDYLKKQTAGFHIDPYQHAFNAGKTRIVQIIEDMLDEAQYQKHVKYLEELKNAETSKR